MIYYKFAAMDTLVKKRKKKKSGQNKSWPEQPG